MFKRKGEGPPSQITHTGCWVLIRSVPWPVKDLQQKQGNGSDAETCNIEVHVVMNGGVGRPGCGGTSQEHWAHTCCFTRHSDLETKWLALMTIRVDTASSKKYIQALCMVITPRITWETQGGYGSCHPLFSVASQQLLDLLSEYNLHVDFGWMAQICWFGAWWLHFWVWECGWAKPVLFQFLL